MKNLRSLADLEDFAKDYMNRANLKFVTMAFDNHVFIKHLTTFAADVVYKHDEQWHDGLFKFCRDEGWTPRTVDELPQYTDELTKLREERDRLQAERDEFASRLEDLGSYPNV
jgi:hypothetical protein